MPYLNTVQAAERLGINPSLVRRYCLQGRLGKKIGRNYAITERDLERFAALERRPGWPKPE